MFQSNIFRIGSAVLASATILGCGPTAEGGEELSNATAANHDQSTNSLCSIKQLDIPSGYGVKYEGTRHIKNGDGTCMVRSGAKVNTAACSNDDCNQFFAIYKMEDGRYNACEANMPTYFEDVIAADFDGISIQSRKGYSAECLARDYTSSSKLMFGRFPLAFSLSGAYVDGQPVPPFGPYHSWDGFISLEEQLPKGNILGWRGSDRKITKAAGGVGLYSKYVTTSPGSAFQQWSVY